jgi:hypothetical protein
MAASMRDRIFDCLCALTEKGVFDLPGTAVTVTIGEGGEFTINIQYPDKGETQ